MKVSRDIGQAVTIDVSKSKLRRARRKRANLGAAAAPTQPLLLPYRYNHPVGRSRRSASLNWRESLPPAHFLVQPGLAETARLAGLIDRIARANVGSIVPGISVASLLRNNAIFCNQMTQFLCRFRRLQLRALLNRVCSLPDQQARSTLATRQVVRFLRTVLYRSRLSSVFGPVASQRWVFRCIRFYVCRPRLASCPLGQLMAGLDPASVPCLASHKSALETHLLAKLLVWLLDDFIRGILVAMFHITDSSHGKFQMFFFRKPVWQSICDRALNSLMKWHLVPIHLADVRNVLASSAAPRTSLLRFLPKKNMSSCRPVARSNTQMDGEKLQLLKIFCKRLADTLPAKADLHGTVLDAKWRALQEGVPTDCPLYWAVVDIEDAYGSVLLPKLGQILAEFPVSPGPESDVLSAIQKRILLHTLQLKLGQKRRRFLVVKGLVQGDILSGFLSDIYYGHMTLHRLARFLEPPPGTAELLLRGMDDFLFISARRDRVEAFLATVAGGFLDYGAVFRQDKTQTNLEVGSRDAELRFCGSIIEVGRREIYPDFSGYSNQNMVYAQRWRLNEPPGTFIRNSFRRFCLMRLRRIYFNRQNSRQRCLATLATIAFIALRRLTGMLDMLIWSKGRKVDHRWLWCVLQVGFRQFALVRKEFDISQDELKWLLIHLSQKEMRRVGRYPPQLLRGLAATEAASARRLPTPLAQLRAAVASVHEAVHRVTARALL